MKQKTFVAPKKPDVEENKIKEESEKSQDTDKITPQKDGNG